MRTTELVSLVDVRAAHERLSGIAVRTPLERSRALSDRLGGDVFIKCENLQRTGSFKLRGAYNRIVRLNERERRAGVVAASAGNHAQGVAFAASLSGARSTVFMPDTAPLPKVEATKRYGAEVILTGKDFGAAYEVALGHARSSGAVFVHPFDHPDVIAGQGTVGLEILEQAGGAQALGSVLVPVGGGGLISGIAAFLRGAGSSARIVGVQAKGAAAFPPSLESGRLVKVEHLATIADGIAANSPGENTLAHVAALVDEVVCVSDESIAEALVFAIERLKLVLEPAGAAGLAAVLERVGGLEPPLVVVLSGGNIDPLVLLRVIRFGLSAAGRYFAFRTRLPDRPGELHRLLGIIAAAGANIVGVDHHRVGIEVQLTEVDVALQVETRGREHIEELSAHLGRAGYEIDLG